VYKKNSFSRNLGVIIYTHPSALNHTQKGQRFQVSPTMDMNPSMKYFSWSEVAKRGLQERILSSKFRRKNGPRTSICCYTRCGFRSWRL
jgi:hypothetical protein